jgi:fermentation-respiration switch protein FrsA (DUF1100 family)
MKAKLAVSSLGILLLLLGACWFAGTILTAPAPHSIGSLPSDLQGRSIQFPSESGSTIHGWFMSGRPGAGAVVLMHGVRANRLSMLDRARFLSRAGFSVLLFDFQAHGESSGEHITFGYLESKDAQAAIKFLGENAPGEKIGVIGVSMGGAATILASPPLQVDAMVLEMVYPTIDQAVRNRITMRLGNWSAFLSHSLTWQLQPRLGIDTSALRPIDRVKNINSPKLFIAGAKDQHTTIEESQSLYETAVTPKELWIVEGAAHVDLHASAKEEYEQRVLSFFESHLRVSK